MKTHVTWALVGASVVLLGFASVRVTDAAWRGSETAQGNTISTGRLSITGAGQTDLDLSGLARENMTTGMQAQIPLMVVNDSTLPVDYRLTGISPRALTTPPALDLRVARVAETSACPTTVAPGTPGTQIYSGNITAARTPATTLATGASDVLCLTTTAQPVTPGQSGHYIFTFEATQR